MALTKSDTAPLPGVAGAPATLTDTTTRPAEMPETDAAFDRTGQTVAAQTAAPAPATGSAVATQGGARGLSILDGVRSEAFSSLDNKIKYGSFPTIKLDKHLFVIKDGEEVTEFLCHILATRPKWIYKTEKTEKGSEELFYSYDQQLATNGRKVEDILADWRADGLKLKECREYEECVVLMHSTSLEGEMALLSVPPASTGRLSGFRTQQNLLRKVELDKVITRVKTGAKITTKSKDTFYPWDFKFVCMADQEIPEDAKPKTA
jgi:hypothetical protein